MNEMRKLMEAVKNLNEYGAGYSSEDDFEDRGEPMSGPAYNQTYKELIEDLAYAVREQVKKGQTYDNAISNVIPSLENNVIAREFNRDEIIRDLEFQFECGSPINEKNINESMGYPLSFEELCNRKEELGIVILGAGGELNEWTEGISKQLKDEGISKTDRVFSEYGIVTGNVAGDGGRTDAYFFFNKNNKINVGKLAMWRIKFGNASWIDDFCMNYAEDYDVKNYFEESIEIIGEDDNNLHNIADALRDIKEQIKDMIHQADDMLQGTDEHDEAKNYWIPHILMALDDEHDYLGGSMNSMEDTINALSTNSQHFDDNSQRPKGSTKRHFDDMSD